MKPIKIKACEGHNFWLNPDHIKRISPLFPHEKGQEKIPENANTCIVMQDDDWYYTPEETDSLAIRIKTWSK